MIYLKLFLVFLKIGFFNFGGGYVMIPLIQREIEKNGWMTTAEFADIIAIAEMTPGAIAINSASFVGYKAGGFLGAAVATAAIPIPSLVLVLLVSRFLLRYKDHPLSKMIFYGIRPVIAGLIVSASMFVAETALFTQHITVEVFNSLTSAPLQLINFGSLFILGLTLFALIKLKCHPILTIIGSGFAGVVLFSFV